jgi:hypothetical protein
VRRNRNRSHHRYRARLAAILSRPRPIYSFSWSHEKWRVRCLAHLRTPPRTSAIANRFDSTIGKPPAGEPTALYDQLPAISSLTDR